VVGRRQPATPREATISWELLDVLSAILTTWSWRTVTSSWVPAQAWISDVDGRDGGHMDVTRHYLQQ
jgi:hypothetical protein